jgi:putative transposase
MPRLPRYVLPGQPQHVIQRGNNRSPIFICENDYHCFRDILKESCEKHGCEVHAWVFMTNHIHLLLTPLKQDSISKMMQSVGRRYVQYFNVTYQRTGTLWEGRYKATVVGSDDYLFTCYRYIELNPVRANMVSHPAEYRWSSYHGNALGKADTLITQHALYISIDKIPSERNKVYRDYFKTHINEKQLSEIRVSTQKGWALGSERFKDEVEELTKRRTRPLPRGGRRKQIEVD